MVKSLRARHHLHTSGLKVWPLLFRSTTSRDLRAFSARPRLVAVACELYSPLPGRSSWPIASTRPFQLYLYIFAMSTVEVSTSPASLTPPLLQATPSSPKATSATHISQVQPHASFFHISRPNESATIRPRPSSFVSTSSGVHNRFLDAIHLAPLSRQLSLGSASDASSSIATRRSPQAIGIKHSREPLLPIGAVPKRVMDSGAPDSPNPSASPGRVRGSFERIFKRATSADSLPASLTKTSPRPSPRPSPMQPTFATPDLEVCQPYSPPPVNDGYFSGQAPPQHASASSPKSPSHHPRFAPLPPANTTAFAPYISPRTGKPERNYEGYPSQNIFFLRGHLLTGGDSPIPFIASFLLVLGISGTWFGTTCVWWWLDESPAVAAVGAYMCLITVASMLATVSGGLLCPIHPS